MMLSRHFRTASKRSRLASRTCSTIRVGRSDNYTLEDIMMLARSLRSLLLAGAALTLAVTAQAAEPTTFTVTIKNVSTSATLKLPDGRTTNVPIAPGVYVVGARPSLL